jgi:hypothetical protein
VLSYEDEPTIKNAIMRRLHEVGKTEIVDIEVVNHPLAIPAHMTVDLWWILRDMVQDTGLIDGRSGFDLPSKFDHKHLVNEIDEVSEQMKEVRRRSTLGRILWEPGKSHVRQPVKGTGLRGRWAS